MGASSSAGRNGPEYMNTLNERHQWKGAPTSCLFSWHPSGRAVACSGAARVIQIFDPEGQVLDQVVPPSPNVCTCLAWSWDGAVLAATQASSAIVVLWTFASKRVQYLDTNVKHLSCLAWTHGSLQMAIGTAKGSVLLYDHGSGARRVAPCKHKKRVVCLCWSETAPRMLAYASEDKQVTVCSATGDVIDQVRVKSRPSGMQFGHRAGRQGSAVTLCMNLDGRSLLLYDVGSNAAGSAAVELCFRPRYGSVTSTFHWLPGGLLMVWFAYGYVVVMSTAGDSMGKEQFCARFHDELRGAVYNRRLRRVATVGDGLLKIVDVDSWTEESHVTVPVDDMTLVQGVSWAPVSDSSSDAHVVSVQSRTGCLYNYRLNPRRRADSSDTDGTHGNNSDRQPARASAVAAGWARRLLRIASKPVSPLFMFLLLALACMCVMFAAAATLGVDTTDVITVALGFVTVRK